MARQVQAKEKDNVVELKGSDNVTEVNEPEVDLKQNDADDHSHEQENEVADIKEVTVGNLKVVVGRDIPEAFKRERHTWDFKNFPVGGVTVVPKELAAQARAAATQAQKGKDVNGKVFQERIFRTISVKKDGKPTGEIEIWRIK